MKVITNSAIYDNLLVLCKIKEIQERDKSPILIFFNIGTDEKSSFTNGALKVISWNKADVCLNVLIFHSIYKKANDYLVTLSWDTFLKPLKARNHLWDDQL